MSEIIDVYEYPLYVSYFGTLSRQNCPSQMTIPPLRVRLVDEIRSVVFTSLRFGTVVTTLSPKIGVGAH